MSVLRGRSTRLLQTLETVLAVSVPLSLWLALSDALRAFPMGISLGKLALPTLVVIPGILGIAVLAECVSVWEKDETLSTFRAGLGLVAGFVVLSATYAILNLNLTQPGVFFSGIPPILFGIILSALILLHRGLRVVHN